MLKKVSDVTHPHEVEISRLFSTEPLASHPRNHCVEIIDVLDVPDEEHLHLLVMPLLRPFDDPLFDTVGEVIDYFAQVFEVCPAIHWRYVTQFTVIRRWSLCMTVMLHIGERLHVRDCCEQLTSLTPGTAWI